ncbi:MAG: AbgT family transporter [Calditrichia bacterium]
MSEKKQKQIPKPGFVDRFLLNVEKAGNALPHPATLFALFALMTVLLSWVAHQIGFEAVHPATGEIIKPVNLLTHDGIHRMILDMVNNYTSFAPLGIVMVAMLGIGIAESSGLIATAIRLLVITAPTRLITFVLVFAGVLSNTASDIGYVLLIPLAGIIFITIGRHPLVGMAAAFAGVSGGFSANLLLGTVDPLLAGLSEEAAHIIDATYSVNPTANYYFMAVSTFVIAIVGTWVTEKIVAPRFGNWQGPREHEAIEKLTRKEKRGLLFATIAGLAILVVTVAGVIHENGFFRGPDGTILSSPLIKGVVAMLFVSAGITGVAYGIGAGKFKSDKDVVHGMSEAMKSLGLYLVLVFFAAQFVAYFKWTNLGIIVAVEGATLLKASGLGVIPLMILFIILSAAINMMMGSASAKWALMAPVFIPMFMLLGYTPELTQVVYRIGDSITNVISPMMSFFPLIIAFFQKYQKDAGIGTVIATMLPYSIAFFIAWTLMLILWLVMGWPLGPGAGTHL